MDLLCFCSVLCLLCLCARLFNCTLWSPAGKGLTSWLSICEFVTFPFWYPGSGVVLDCTVPDLCTLTYFVFSSKSLLSFRREMAQPRLSMATRGLCAQMGGGGVR